MNLFCAAQDQSQVSYIEGMYLSLSHIPDPHNLLQMFHHYPLFVETIELNTDGPSRASNSNFPKQQK